ncbi:MAG TPA: phosphate starvation-inducible protein PhoH [Ruminococcaceae bacterium]|nr:phosphate starvation-inducible protein PhoH [Oscillospiraceae bacterium]HCO37293.1 phosphate starvation-inducible protein PhoH [Oscillospiraceae bacterium]
MIEQIITFEAMEQAVSLFGSFDENIRMIEKEYNVSIVSRGSDLKIMGDAENVSRAVRAVNSLLTLINKGETLSEQNVRYVLSLVNEGNEDKLSAMTTDSICITAKGRLVKPKTLGQKKYTQAIDNNTITFGVGPAGTGKTYLAVAMAVTAFRAKEVNRIILTRPAVEAGEKLGFLPGDLQSKVDPYLRPLYDALFDMLGAENFQRYQERGAIEVAPLAYMRGRTLDDSFIILDEAQNTTPEQMKMFLTRLGFRSKMVVTGDITQIDLPDGKQSGLKKVLNILKNVNDIEIVKFNHKDVVRHRLVQDIINAYEKYENSVQNNKNVQNNKGEGR